MTELSSAPVRVGGRARLACLVVAAIVGGPQCVVDAAVLTTSMPVSVTIGGATGACSSLTANGLAFGTLPASGSITTSTVVGVTCSSGIAYSLTGAGSNGTCIAGALFSFMGPATASNTAFPGYSLYKDAANSQALATPGGTACGTRSAITGTGNGSTQTLTIYGTALVHVPGAQTPPPGTYNDTAVLQITF